MSARVEQERFGHGVSKNGSPNDSTSTSTPSPAAAGAARRPPAPGRQPVGVGHRDPLGEVDGVGPVGLRGRVGEVQHRGGVDRSPAGVLDGHGEAELAGGVAQGGRAGDAADAGELDRDAVGAGLAARPHELAERDDRLVQHERVGAMRPQRRALLDRRARLLQRVVERARGEHEAARGGGRPGAVCVRVEDDVRADGVAHRREPLGVGDRVAADLHLQPAVAVGDVAAGAGDHGVERAGRDRSIQVDRVPEAAAERLAQRLVAGAGGRVPAGHVERRLDVRLAAHRRVHQPQRAGAADAGRRRRRGARARRSPPARRPGRRRRRTRRAAPSRPSRSRRRRSRRPRSPSRSPRRSRRRSSTGRPRTAAAAGRRGRG